MIFVYDRYMELQATLSNTSPQACPYFRDEFTETLPYGYTSLEFECPADHPSASYLEADGYISKKDRDGLLRLFKVSEMETHRKKDGERFIRVYAEGISMELYDQNLIRPATLATTSILQLVLHALDGTAWEVGEIEFLGTRTIVIEEHTTPLKLLHQIADEFDAEIRFRVEAENSRRVKKYVDLVERRGDDNGLQFDYSRNIKGLVRKMDTDGHCTALIGIGNVEEDSDAFLTFDDVEWSTDVGHPANKPYDQDWIGDDEALQTWGRDGRHKFGIFEYDTTDPEELIDATWRELQRVKEPKLTYEVDLLLMERFTGYDKQKVRLGDTIIVKDTSFDDPILVSARVTEIIYSDTDPSRDRVTLSNFKPMEINIRNTIEELRRLVRRRQSVWELTGDAIHKDTTPPSVPSIDDLWLDTSEEPEVLKRWNGSYWVKASPTEAAELGAISPEEAQAIANESAEIAQLRNQRQRLYENKMEKDAAFSKVHGDDNLVNASVQTELQNAKLDYDDKHADLITAISVVIASGEVTEQDEDDIEDAVDAFEGTLPRLEEAFREAQAAIIYRTRELAVQDAQDYVIDYAEKEIAKGDTEPFDPEEGDIWIDTAYNPPVWKRYIDNEWDKFTRTELSELQGQISEEQIENNAIVESKLADLAVTLDKIASDSIDSTKITENAIETVHLSAGVVTADAIAANSINADKIQSNAITTDKIEANAITTSLLDANAVTADKIAVNTITADEIASGTITTDLISSAGIDAGVIMTGVLDANRIDSGSITTDKIAAGGISAEVITSGEMSFDRLEGGTATLGGEDNGYGALQVLNAEGEAIVDISSDDAGGGGFAGLVVGKLHVTDLLDAPNVIYKNEVSYTIHVRPNDGNDDDDGTSWGNALYSIQEAVDRIPDMNHGHITIQCTSQDDFYENVTIPGKNGAGSITLDLNGRTLHGRLAVQSCSIRVVIVDGTISRTGGVSVLDNEGSVYIGVDNLLLNGNDSTSYGIRTWRGGNTYVSNTEVHNTDVAGFDQTSLGRAFITGCSGYGGDYGVRSRNGGIAHLGSTIPGGDVAAYADTGSALTVGSASVDLGSAVPPEPPVTEVTEDFTAVSAESWRDVYNDWRSNGRVYQGEWNGFGRHKGCWFMGSTMRNTLQGKTIKRVRVRATRLDTGGYSASRPMVFRMHSHSSQPSGEPNMSNTNQSVNFARGETKWFTLSSDFHSLLSNGSWYGMGLYTTSRANSNYGVFSGNITVRVTYED